MTDWILEFIRAWGALGVGVLMFVENIFPPIPSEVVLPLTGYRASQGDLSAVAALFAATIGSLVGVTLWYYAGRLVGTERLKRWAGRHGRWLTLTPRDVDRANAWFDRHGGKAVLIGRLFPGVRTLISIPAGVCEMPLGRFLAMTAIGSFAWNSVLISSGWFLGAGFEQVEQYVSPVGNVLIGLAVLIYIYRVVTFSGQVEPPVD